MKAVGKSCLYFLPAFFFIQLGKHFWPDSTLVLGRRIDYLSPTIHVFDLAIIVLFLFNSSALWSRLWFRLTGSLLLLGWLFMLFFSRYPIVVFFGGARWFLMFGLLAEIVLLRPALRSVQKIFAVCVIGVTLLALAQFLAQHSLGGWFYWLGERSYSIASGQIAHLIAGGRLLVRPYGTFSHPNVFGGILTTLLPLLLFFKIKTKSDYLLIQTARIFTVFGIGLSFSRAAWLVTALVLVAFSITRWKITKKSLLLPLVVIGLFIFEEVGLGRIATLTELQNQSVAERQVLARVATDLMLKQPLTGYGFGHFIPLLPTVSKPPFLLQPVHSVYLLAAVEVGILATVVLCGFVVWLLGQLWRLQRQELFWSLVALLLLGTVDHYFWSTPQPLALATFLTGSAFAQTRQSAVQ